MKLSSKVHMPRAFVIGWSRPVDRMFVVYLGPWRFAWRSVWDGDPVNPCGRGPCCLGDGHEGECKR